MSAAGGERPSQKQEFAVLAALLRWRYVLLTALGAALLAGGAPAVTVDNDWQFFAFGSDLLFGQERPLIRSSYTVEPDEPGGLHLYASYPFLQIGPPPLLLAKVLQVGPREGLLLAGAGVQALGVLFVIMVDRAFPREGLAARLACFGAAVVVVASWATLGHYRHLDDALALAAIAAALWALQRDAGLACGTLLGVAAASKPWAVVGFALVLALPDARGRIYAVTAAVGTAIAFWGPFLIADLGTLDVGRLPLPLAQDSALSALGATGLVDSGFLRLLQLGLGLLLGVFLVTRGHWATAVLAGFAFRLALDPSAYLYYGAALIAAAYVADMADPRAGLPWWTALTTAGYVAALVTTGDTAGMLRLLTYGAVVVLAIVLALLHPRSHLQAVRRRSGQSPGCGPVGHGT